MSCLKEIVPLMHKELDDEITEEERKILHRHLQSCRPCSLHFAELKRTIALVEYARSAFAAPDSFTHTVMSGLPEHKKRSGAVIWLKNHPILSAASLFLFFMAASFLSAWSDDHHFSVSKQPNLLVKNKVVTVPEGETVKGDVTVKNGMLRIEGTVDGNVTVINGEEYKASAGRVTGKMEDVDELFEWLWYRIKSAEKETAAMFH